MMTKQCKFCGNVYDANEECCPFCMAENDSSDTYYTDKTTTTRKTITVTKNINGHVTTKTKSFTNDDFDFSEKSVDEIKNEINRMLEQDDAFHKTNQKITNNAAKGRVLLFIVIVAILMSLFFFLPMFVVFNFKPTGIKEELNEFAYDDCDRNYSNDCENQYNHEYEYDSRDENLELAEIMTNNPESYFLTDDGSLYYLHVKVDEKDTSPTTYTWWIYSQNMQEWFPQSGSNATDVSPVNILNSRISKDLSDLIILDQLIDSPVFDITDSERYNNVVYDGEVIFEE